MRLDFSIFFAYTDFMSKVYISELGSPQIIEYLLADGHTVLIIGEGSTKFDNHPHVQKLLPAANVAPAISCHPDILHCALRGGKVFHGMPNRLGAKYPEDVLYNGCSTGKYFIHNLKHTAPRLMAETESLGLKKIHVSHGYSRCTILPVDEDSVITSDRGVASSCSHINVLLISPGYIFLPGYNTGFIGGTGGRVGDAILFNGDLSAHPDFAAIKDFVERRGLKCIWTTDIPLTDIGSIIEEKI